MSAITHFQAQLMFHGASRFPIRGAITDEAVLELANEGTTPHRVSPELRDKADRIRGLLLSGRLVRTATAEIWPLTTADFQARKLTVLPATELVEVSP